MITNSNSKITAKISLVFLVSFLSAISEAATRFVDGDLPADCASGNYSVDNRKACVAGTGVSAWNSIEEGLANTSAGDTLYIRGGTYDETISSMPSGEDGKPVIVAAYLGEPVILKPTSSSMVISLTSSAFKYIVFDGITIDANNANTSYTAVLFDRGANNIHMKNAEVRNSTSTGIFLGDGNGSHQIINMKIHDTGWVQGIGHGMYITGSNNLVEGCDIYHNNKFGITIFSGSSWRPSNNVVRGNKIHDNGFASTGGTLGISSGDNNIAYNNIIYGNPKWGIQIQYNNPTNTKVYNNTIYNNGFDAIYVGSESSGTVIKNNIYFANGGGIINNSGSTTQSSNLTVDPKFVNAGAGDFHLQSTSSAINAGVFLSEVEFDFDGVPRPQGSAYDIGAFELKSSTASTRPMAPTSLRVQ